MRLNTGGVLQKNGVFQMQNVSLSPEPLGFLNKLNTVNNHVAREREFNGCQNLEDLLRRYRFWDYSK